MTGSPRRCKPPDGNDFLSLCSRHDLTSLTLRGVDGGIAVLDQMGNRVYFHPTDETFEEMTGEEPQTIGFGGQSVGANTIKTLFDIR